MKEIIGDDHPTYEDSVNMTLAEKNKKPHVVELLMEQMKENIELKHRLACIADDIEIIERHIQNNCNKRFKRPSRNKDGSVFAEQAWHNITNVQIACDLNDDDVLEWNSDVKKHEH